MPWKASAVLWLVMGICLLASAAVSPAASLPLRPDSHLTPGDTFNVTKNDICVPGYAREVRDVPLDVKWQAYKEYGIQWHRPGDFEVDHLISLELGGSNRLRNLWPESYKTHPWNAHVKDQLENELHREVCEDEIDLKTAQREISTDWIAAYKRHFHTQVPLSEQAAARIYNGRGHGFFSHAFHAKQSGPSTERGFSTSHPGSLSILRQKVMPPSYRGLVWVNTRSGIYWPPGTEYYGKTRQGKYMREDAAIKAGYRPAEESQWRPTGN